MELLYKTEVYKIIGAAMTVHRYFGPGFKEKVYQDALEIEFKNQGIPFMREHPLHATYKGVELATEFIPDFICYDKIIVELKALQEIDDWCRLQTFNYTRVAKVKLGLLINFGNQSLEYERYVV